MLARMSRPPDVAFLVTSPRRACLAACLIASAVFPSQTRGHDIPNERVDRAIQLTLEPQRLRVDYEVSLAELTLVQDLKRLVGHIDETDRTRLCQHYCDVVGPLNAKGFLASLDGTALELAYTSATIGFDQHPKLLFHFQAALPSRGRLHITDTNYISSEGTSRLACRAAHPVRLDGFDGHADVESIEPRPVWMLSDSEEAATKELTVEFLSDAPALEPPRESTAPPHSSQPAEPRPHRLADLLTRGGPASLALMWLAALGLGAAHALQPGHGKTLVAAASLGPNFNWRSATVLALATTLAHFSSVALIAAGLWFVPQTRYAAIQQGTLLAAGFLLGILGFWRIGRSLSPTNPTSPNLPTPAQNPPTRLRELFALGASGGIVPCWDAVLLLVVAALAGQLLAGVFLLTGFSLGMALVLLVVGIGAGRARAILSSRTRAPRLERTLEFLSGLILAACAIAFLAQAV